MKSQQKNNKKPKRKNRSLQRRNRPKKSLLKNQPLKDRQDPPKSKKVKLLKNNRNQGKNQKENDKTSCMNY